MKKRKIIKRILVAVLWIAIIVGACIFPYPALFMGHSLPRQPNLSVNEKLFFDQLRKEYSWSEISRMYCNIDSIGEEIWIHDIPIDFKARYVYCIRLETQDTLIYYANSTQENALAMAKYIKDSICFNSPQLFGIEIDIKYKDAMEDSRNSMYRYYQFYHKKDSMILKKKMSLIPWEEEF